jgi:hypothetical protein
MMRTSILTALLALALIAAGCGLSLNTLMLVNPRTGQRVNCQGTPEQVKDCMERYKLEGYQADGVMPGPAR